MRKLAESLQHLLVPELTIIAEVDGQGVGAIIGLPDYNPRIKLIDGKLFPFGIFRLLSKKRDIKRIRVFSINVVPEFQRWGLGLVLMRGLTPMAMQMGIQEAEFSWIDEDNDMARLGLEKGGAKVYKTYRMYDYEPNSASARSLIAGPACRALDGRAWQLVNPKPGAAPQRPQRRPSSSGCSFRDTANRPAIAPSVADAPCPTRGTAATGTSGAGRDIAARQVPTAAVTTNLRVVDGIQQLFQIGHFLVAIPEAMGPSVRRLVHHHHAPGQQINLGQVADFQLAGSEQTAAPAVSRKQPVSCSRQTFNSFAEGNGRI